MRENLVIWSRAAKWGRIFLAVVLLLGFTAGCKGKAQEYKAEGNKKGEYSVYYLTASATKLVPQTYKTDTENVDQLIEELMGQFLNVPNSLDCQTALSDKVEYQKFSREDVVVYLYFDDAYSSMKPEREILCRAALAETLTQIDGVDYINIYTGGQPLTDSKGKTVGMISGGDFINSISDINTFEKTELILYFTDEKGEKLYAERREVVYNINSSLEKLVVDQLIAGPQGFNLCPTLSRNTKLLNISMNDNICYLNFDSEFLDGSLEVRDYIPIYSIVNSLAELNNVSKVQISVNGSKDIKFRDTISLDTLFERNLDCIGGEN